MARTPIPDERPTDLRVAPAGPAEYYQHPDDGIPGRLPVAPDVRTVQHVRYLSVHAVVTAKPGELRIPYLTQKDAHAGDFAAFMDVLVDRFMPERIRFTNVFMEDDAAADAYDELNQLFGKDGADRRLEDVLDSFTHDIEHWNGKPVDTLVGQWDPARNRTDAPDREAALTDSDEGGRP